MNNVYKPSEYVEGREGQQVLCPVPAGWPSPAEDYVEDCLDLHQYVVKNPSATFFIRISGHSMVSAGIHDGDIIVVDRSLMPQSGKVVVAAVAGELTVKRLKKKNGKWFLVPENFDNPNYPEIEISGLEDACIWGVVTYALHRL